MKKLTVGLILVLAVTAIVGCSPAALHGGQDQHANEGADLHQNNGKDFEPIKKEFSELITNTKIL